MRWQALALAAGLAGLGVSIYLTVVHYSAIPVACPATAQVNCEQVLASPYGVIAGSAIPTSAAGIVWFALSALLAPGPVAGRGEPARRQPAGAVLGWRVALSVSGGMVFLFLGRAWLAGGVTAAQRKHPFYFGRGLVSLWSALEPPLDTISAHSPDRVHMPHPVLLGFVAPPLM